MIIMINGAFGVGKTTISNELVKVLENSMFYDPEEAGYMLRNMLPEKNKTTGGRDRGFPRLLLMENINGTYGRVTNIHISC